MKRKNNLTFIDFPKNGQRGNFSVFIVLVPPSLALRGHWCCRQISVREGLDRWTTFCKLDKYTRQFGPLEIWPNAFCNLDKYILKFDKYVGLDWSV